MDRNSLKGVKKAFPDEWSKGWGVHRRQSEWDIIATTTISIEQKVEQRTYTRSADLVFGRPSANAEYRWYEMAFWSWGRNDRRPKDEPFCLGYVWEIDKALSKVIDANSLAYDPTPIDSGELDEFIDVWIGLVIQAMSGKLVAPGGIPMRSRAG
jgi:hypothetical protein